MSNLTVIRKILVDFLQTIDESPGLVTDFFWIAAKKRRNRENDRFRRRFDGHVTLVGKKSQAEILLLRYVDRKIGDRKMGRGYLSDASPSSLRSLRLPCPPKPVWRRLDARNKKRSQ
jgi:hypothetical protein